MDLLLRLQSVVQSPPVAHCSAGTSVPAACRTSTTLADSDGSAAAHCRLCRPPHVLPAGRGLTRLTVTGQATAPLTCLTAGPGQTVGGSPCLTAGASQTAGGSRRPPHSAAW